MWKWHQGRMWGSSQNLHIKSGRICLGLLLGREQWFLYCDCCFVIAFAKKIVLPPAWLHPWNCWVVTETSHCRNAPEWGAIKPGQGMDFLSGCDFPGEGKMAFTDRTSLSLKGKMPAHLRVGLSPWSSPWEKLGMSLTIPVYFPEERLQEGNKTAFLSRFHAASYQLKPNTILNQTTLQWCTILISL